MLRTIAALFDNPRDAREVIGDLEKNGFDRSAIMCVARPDNRRHRDFAVAAVMTERLAATGMRLLAGSAIGGLIAVVVMLLIVAVAGREAVLPAGGATTFLLAVIAGAIAGGVIGAITTFGLTDDDAQLYADGVRRGLTLVAVDSEGEKAGLVERIMRTHQPIDLERRADRLRTHPWMLASASAYASEEHRRARASALATVPRAPGSRVYNFYDAMTGRRARAGQTRAETTPTAESPAATVQPYPDIPFRSHFHRHYRAEGDYEQYLPAYRYGYLLGTRLETGSWENTEREMKTGWEHIQPGTWRRYSQAVRYGWEVARAERGDKP